MTAPTTRRQPASPPGGQPAQAQARRQAHNRRKTRAKLKSEALRPKEAAVELCFREFSRRTRGAAPRPPTG
jgi:hypothetical protein